MGLLASLFGGTKDPATILREVERRRFAALRTGFPQLVNSMYHFQFKYYPHWIGNAVTSNLIPKIVEQPTSSCNGSDTTISFGIKKHIYKIIFHEPTFMMADKREDNLYRLELYQNDVKVLALRGKLAEVVYVDAFRDGPWMADFRLLNRAIQQLEVVTNNEGPRNAMVLEELKKNFDIA